MFRFLMVILFALPALSLAADATTYTAPTADRVRLAGHVLPALAGAEPVKTEASRDKELLTLTLVLKRDDQAGFESYLHDVYDTKSSQYRHFLSQKELTEKFGPSRDAYDSVLSYLKKNGFELAEGSANRLTLTVRGNRSRVEKAFGVHIRDYSIGERRFYANDTDPELPPALASRVTAVSGLTNLAKPRPAEKAVKRLFAKIQCWFDVQAQKTTAADGLTANSSAEEERAAYKKCLTAKYNEWSLGAIDTNDPPPPAWQGVDGTGQKVGVVAFDTFQMSDVQDYIDLIGLPSAKINNLSRVPVNGGASLGPNQSEVLLDIANILSIAPGAQIAVYDAPFTGGGSFQALFNAMIGDGVTVISNSWAYCEDQTTLADVQSIDSILQTAASLGISVFSGSGDNGSTCLDGSPNTAHVPATSTYITAVGGTSFTPGPGFTYGSETWWDSVGDTPPGGQGGFGVSRFFGRPGYQDGLNGLPMRSIPDVAANADPAGGVIICQASAGGCPNGQFFGGTSSSSPIWAAFTALLNQARGSNLGFLNPLIYPLANTDAFHNAASMGSDFAHVGLGSPNLPRLHQRLTGHATGPVSPSVSEVRAYTAGNYSVPEELSAQGVPLFIPADGTSEAVVVVRLADGNGSTIDGKTVTLAASPGSHAVISPASDVTKVDNGAAVFRVTNLTAEPVIFTALDTTDGIELDSKPDVAFTVPPATSAGINAFPGTVTANGIDTATVTVTLQDALGRPTPGKRVTLAQGNGHAVITGPNPSITDSNGQIQFAAANLVNEVVTFTAVDVSDGNLPIPGNGTVTFTNGSGGACGQNVTPPVGLNGYTVTPFATGFPVGALFYSNVNYGGCSGVATPGFLNGNVYVPDFFNGDLYKLGGGGGAVSNANKLSTLGPTLSWPVVGKDGHLYATRAGTGGNFNTGVIVELNPDSGALVRTLASNLTCPAGLAVDPLGGDLFFIDQCFGAGSDNPSLFRLRNPGGASPTVEVYATLPFTPNGQVVFSPKGTIYVVTGYVQQNPPVYRVSGTDQPTPPTVTPVAGVASNYWVNIGEVSPDGEATRLLVLNEGRLKLTDITTNPPAVVGELAEGTGGGIIGPDGCLYMPNTNVLHKLTDPSGGCSFLPTNAMPSITLTPTVVSPNPAQAGAQTFTATFRNVDVPVDTPVFFSITGANSQLQLVRTNAGGQAALTYIGESDGMDTIVATATVNNTHLTSNNAKVTWTPGKHVSYLTLNLSPTAGTVGQPITVKASLTDVSSEPPLALANASINFTLGSGSCQATTDANGLASCQITPQTVGVDLLTANFSGNAGFVESNDSVGFNVMAVPAETPNLPPVAVAGANQTDRQGSLVTLNGGASHDPDNGPSPLGYRWTKASGPNVTLSGANTAMPTFVAAAAGQYLFDLVVNDGADDSPASQVSITVPLLGDVDLDGDVDNDDLKLVVAARNTAANGPNDLKDINGDMKVDALDTRKLTLLCTRPRCATQ